MNQIGNVVHDTCVISDNEDNNGIVRTWGTPRKEAGLLNHYDLMTKMNLIDLERGACFSSMFLYEFPCVSCLCLHLSGVLSCVVLCCRL